MPLKPKEPNSIMLVDDNNISLFVCRKIIQKSGRFKEIIEFQDPVKALEYLETAAGNNTGFPDMMLLDIQMPILNGFEFLAEFRKLPVTYQDYCTVCILTSSYNETDIERVSNEKSVHRLLKKPLTLEMLVSITNELYEIRQ